MSKARTFVEILSFYNGTVGNVNEEIVGKIVIILATVKSKSTKLVSRNPEFRIRDSAMWAQSR